MPTAFEFFAIGVVMRNEDNLMEYDTAEQIARCVQALEHFHKTTPLTFVTNEVINLAGFGEVPVHFHHAETDNRYVLLSQAAEQLGMTPWDACRWAEREHAWALTDQRREDEERGDGLLGYDYLRGLVDLRVWFIGDNPQAKPDAGGKRHSDYGDWLVGHDRIMSLMLASPWQREFMDNVQDAFAHGMKKFLGDKLSGLTAYHADGTPAPGVDLFHTDLTEEEARRKARRGPNVLPD